MTTSGPFHRCPGGCGRDVRREHFACPTCWRRLPFDLARRIRAHYGRDAVEHSRAMGDARYWFRSHMGVRT